MSIDREMVETATESDGAYRSYRPGKISWTIQAAHFFSDLDFAALKTLVESSSAIELRLSTRDASKGLKGSGFITSISIASQVAGYATYQMTIQGTEALTSP